MTESEWLECVNPDTMLYYLQDSVDAHKFRLFVVACCRRIWHRMTDARSRSIVVASECHIDGLLSDQSWIDATAAAHAAWADTSSLLVPWLYGEPSTPMSPDEFAATNVLHSSTSAARSLGLEVEKGRPRHWGRAVGHAVAIETARAEHEVYPNSPERPIQCHLLRDIVGNPFRRISINPALLSPIVFNLAQAAYDERIMPSGELDPDRLAILSDALEEAACDDADILNHLRSPGPHVRGCWVVDLLTGRS